jgi:branched-chain amino acid transport system ATP-binding protein
VAVLGSGARPAGEPARVESGSAVLEIEDVAISFGGVAAVDGVSFEVDAGELFALIGPNGAGKTSIFNCISGVYRPSGSIRFMGRELVGMAPHRIAALGVARTFQNLALFHTLTVLDNLMLGRHQHVRYGPLAAACWLGPARREETRHRRAAEEVIRFLELEPHRHRPVRTLPYGVQKRVELGRALAMEPRLLLLDEPVAGMNQAETEEMARFIVALREELGVPTILVEHDMGLVMRLADRVLVVEFGRPVALDVPERVQRDPEVIRAYLGIEDT